MYNNKFRPRGIRQSNPNFAGKRRIRTFDPTNFIAALNVDTPSYKDVISSPQIQKAAVNHTVTHSFMDFPIAPEIIRNVLDKGYKEPTPIQDQAITPILEGRDLIGIANTGTGKTAAFLIPLVNKVLKNKNQKVLIVAPTRELANQIQDELFGFSRGLSIYSALCIGGASMGKQINDIRRNPNFVIGTPGRIEDLIRSHYLDISRFESVVLDEADLMVDIGFIRNVRYIVSLLPRLRQSLFFSATLDGQVRDILQSFVKNPVTVTVKTGETSQNVEQKVIKIADSSQRIEHLHTLLIKKEFEKVLVFGRTKRGVQRLSDELSKRGFRSEAIHGNKSQSQRLRALDKFKKHLVQILIATDVASRGLDIPNVSHVINFDLPESREAYIHRIGRTGRADKKGIALTFVN